jgi:quinoprotein glucose dehydrogenase
VSRLSPLVALPAAAGLALVASVAAGGGAGKGPHASWTHYGGDQAGTRYSSLDQINRGNVEDLTVAWRYSTGELKRRGPELIANSSTQTTAIIAAGSLVFCTPFNRIVALDPATGRERWVFDPKIPLDHPLPFQYNCRGVTPWEDPEAPAGAACASRIIMGANDGRIYAVDARTGRACADFGEGGSVQVSWDRASRWKGEVKIASAPVVVNGVIATGAFVMDNLRTDAPTGSIYAFDARTGAPKWRFDTIPRDPADPGLRPGSRAAPSARVPRMSGPPWSRTPSAT